MRSHWPLLSFLLTAFPPAMAQSAHQQGMKAIYYRAPGFSDTAFIRVDDKINLRFDTVQTVRWLGYIIPTRSGGCTFSMTCTGNVSLWVNDSLIIHYADESPASADSSGAFVHSYKAARARLLSGSLPLTAGIQYYLKVECISTTLAILDWQYAGGQRQTVPSNALIPEGAEMPPLRVMTNVIGRDPEVTPGPDGNYYMVHTSCYLDGQLSHKHAWDNNDGLHLWKSADMRNWEDKGLIWSIEKDGTWQKAYDEKGRRPLWAPEIHYIKKMHNWYIVYSMGTFAPLGIRTGLMKSLTRRPEGPYRDVVEGPITEGIDGSLYEENDTVYFLRNHCLIARMNETMTGFAEPFRPLQTISGKNVGFEGSGMLKLKGRYYLYSAKSNLDMGSNTYDLNIAVADNIYGPYSESWLALRHGGHSSLFVDRKGDIWATLFGSDDLSDLYITPALVRLARDTSGRLLPLRGNARMKVLLPATDTGSTTSRKHSRPVIVPNEIWLERRFDPGRLSRAELDNLLLYISYDTDVEVYLNGIEACRMTGSNKFSLKKISDQAKRGLRNGRENVLTIHYRGLTNSLARVGLVTWTGY